MSEPLNLKAKRRYLDERSKPRNPKLNGEENFLTESYQFKFFSEKSDKYENTLYEESDIYKDEREEAQVSSCRRIFEQHFKIFENWNVEDLLPRGNCLGDLLKVDQKYTQSWHQPVLLGGRSTEMEHRIINVLGFSEKSLLSAYEKYMEALLAQRKNVYNAMHFPVFVQTMKISKDSYFELLQAKNDGKVSHTITVEADDPNLIDVPVGITFSDGYCFSLTIKFPWERIPSDTNGLYVPLSQSFAYTFCKMPRPLVNFLNQAPAMYMDNADHLLKLMESFMNDFFNFKCFKLKVFDLGSLAVAAGCRMDSMDIFSLAVVCTGYPFPVNIESMDQRWAWSSSETENDIIWNYLDMRLFVMSQIYLIFMGSLIRNLFPDPDIALYALRMSQESFITWFSCFVATALVDTSIDDTSGLGDAKSRSELLRLIKTGSNPHLEQLADLYSSVPVPQCGGERYLHHARSTFIHQFSVLERIHLQGYCFEQPSPRPDVLDKKYELLYKREYVIDDSGAPCYYIGLQPSPQFADSIYELDLEGASPYKVENLKPMYGRQIIPALCEWIRLNHHIIPHFMSRLEGLSTDELKIFWIEHIRVYDYMRACMLRLSNLRGGVRALDLVLAKRQDNTREHLAQIASANPGRKGKERLDLLDDTVHHETDDRVGLVQSVYQAIPGSNAEENRRKAIQRKHRQAEYVRYNPDALSSRDYQRAKKMRIMHEVAVKVGERKIVNDPVASLPSRSVPQYSGDGQGTSSGGSRQEELPLRRLSSQDARHSLSRKNPSYQIDGSASSRLSSRGSSRSIRRGSGGYSSRNYY